MQLLKDHVRDLLARPVFEPPPEPDCAFAAAMEASVAATRRLYPAYERFLAGAPRQDGAPAIFLPVLKSLALVPTQLAIAATIQTSGSSGQPVQIPLDAFSLENRITLMQRMYEAMGFADVYDEAFCFLIDPASSNMAGSVVTLKALARYSRLKQIHVLGKLGANGLELDEAALGRLFTAQFAGPVLLVGYPAMITHVIEHARRRGVTRAALPTGSSVLTGGGWKTFLPGVKVEPAAFRAAVAAFFAVEATGIRDMYGLTESPVVFVECERQHFHIPSFCRVSAVEPLTQAPVADGEVGLLKILSPFSSSFPLAAILTTDKISISARCPCGRGAPYFVPHGRARAATFETCAMSIDRQVA